MTQKRFKKLLMSRGFTKRTVDELVAFLKQATIMYHKDASKELRELNISYRNAFYNLEAIGRKLCDFGGKVEFVTQKKLEELQEKENGQRNIS